MAKAAWSIDYSINKWGKEKKKGVEFIEIPCYRPPREAHQKQQGVEGLIRRFLVKSV